MPIEELFISFEIALKLKKIGFNEPCIAWYCNDMNILYSNMYYGNIIEVAIEVNHPKQLSCYAPLYQQVIDWFRDIHNIHFTNIEDAGLYLFTLKYHNGNCFIETPIKSGEYYIALTYAIEEAIKAVKIYKK